MAMAGIEYELLLRSKGYQVVAGADEVGRGAWAGPVVAAAVVLQQDVVRFVEGIQRDGIN